MFYEQSGTSVWYATPDAPAPGPSVTAAANGRIGGLSVTVGVKPIAARNSVQLRYRINGGAPVTVTASLARTDVHTSSQYFVAALPDFRAGDTVDYVVLLLAPGKQIAAGGDAAKFPSTFHVVAAGQAHPAPNAPPAPNPPAAARHTARPPKNAAQQRMSGAPKVVLSKAQLVALYDASSLTLPQIVTHNSSLVASLEAKIMTQYLGMVNDAFAGCSAKLAAAVTKIDLTPAARAVLSLRQVLVTGFKAEKLDPATARESLTRIERLERLARLPDLATTAIRDNPLFHEELAEATVYKLTDTIDLPEAKAAALVEAAGAPGAVDDAVLGALVNRKVLTPDEAGAIGLVFNLYHLTRESVELTAAVKKKAATWRDVLMLSVADWEQAIAASKVTPPDGLDDAGYAAALRRAATEDHPTDTLLAPSAAVSSPSLAQAIAAAAPLAAANERSFSQPFAKLDTSGVPGHTAATAQDAHRQLLSLANRHPGLGFADILNGSGTPQEKAAAMSERLAAVQKLRDLNRETEFMGLDYTHGSPDLARLKTDGIEPARLQMAIADFKATQRVHTLVGNVDHTNTLMAAGYSSAHSIATEKYAHFLQRSGLSEPAATQYYLKARDALMRTSHMALSSIDALKDLFNHLHVGNAHPDVQDYLKAIPGFADLFGNQDYCDCSECQSILGAAAYFVDLMSFIEHNVLSEVFVGAKAKDQLNLKVRRPDLWTLVLSCDNTNTLVPYLDIINDILENYIATRRGFTASLNDRRAVEKAVYQDALSVSHSSFRQPFTLSLLELDTYLEYFSVPRAQIARTLMAQDAVVVRAALKVSADVYNQLVQAKADLNRLQSLYGGGLQPGSKNDVFANVTDMLDATGYARSDLGAVLATRFVTKGGTIPIQLKSEKRSPASVQNDTERIHGMTLEALDLLHRFTLLKRAAGWTIAELDMVLSQIGSTGLATGISEATLSRIAQILALQSRWNPPLDQNCALWSEIPTVTLDPTQGSLFDRLFNFAPFVLLDGPLPKPTVSFVHSSFRSSGTPLPADNTTHRLLAGLQVSDGDLALLIANLAAALGANLAATDDTQRGFLLTAQNLGLLYRHALAARLLGIPVRDLFQLIQIAGIPNQHLSTLEDVTAAATFYDWYSASGYSLDDLGVITRGPVRRPAGYPDPNAAAQTLVAGIARDHALEFAETVLAFSPGITESQSKQILAANSSLFEAVPNSPNPTMRLASAFRPGVAITIPAGVPIASGDAANALLKYHSSQLVPARLAGILNIDPTIVVGLVTMTGVDLSADAIVKANQGGDITPLTSLVSQLIPLKVLFSAAGYDADGVNFIAQNGAVFGIVSFNTLTVANVRRLSAYSTTAANLTDATPLRLSLAAFSATSFFNNADPVALATALGVDPRVLATLLPNVTLPSMAPDAFSALSAVAALAATLGVGGDTLALTLSDDYGREDQANQAILAAFRARYPVQQDFLNRLKPLADKIRSAKRDALTDYILRSMGLEFQTLDDLYNYFLLDVQLEGCAQTSKVVAAISSAQLYVYRCLMNLEQDRRSTSDPAHIHVPPHYIPADEWAWRQNYRVWQANRKVFLFPETYIEPGLRDDKTPLFEDLESNLLQQPINEQNVLDAYSAYLAGFDQISRLRIAGSYQEIDAAAQSDTLHVFGATTDDPPAYYYRKIENAIYGERDAHKSTVYSAWKPVSVQIPVREVSPVVYLGRLFVFWTEVKTRSVNTIKDGNSQFSGYRHHLTLKHTTLRADGNWSAPQAISLDDKAIFPTGEGLVDDPLGNPLPWENQIERIQQHPRGDFFGALQDAVDLATLSVDIAETPRYDTKIHTAPKDDYTLEGFQWERVYPGASSNLVITGRNFGMRAVVDFYNKRVAHAASRYTHHSPIPRVLCAKQSGANLDLYTGMQVRFGLDDYAWCSVVADDRQIERLSDTIETISLVPAMKLGLYSQRLGTLHSEAEIAIINNSPGDAILDTSGDLLLLQGSVRPWSHLLRRLSTTLGESLCRKLFTSGVQGLLDINTQTSLGESVSSLHPTGGIDNLVVTGKMDFKGSLGTYFREIFFHVPFLIATQLNSQGKYKAAQEWYQYIFNPTVDDTVNLPHGTPPAKAAKMERDRVWRYVEFRNLDVPKLRDILTDPAAIETYKKDPFNPHAIARLRLSAYQKCVVMKYIDNIIDWADSLFREFTMESVNEASLLYVTALEILGQRPAEIGDCGQTADETRTYEKIAPLLTKGSDFLVELETYTLVRNTPVHIIPKVIPKFIYTLPHLGLTHRVNEAVAIHAKPALQAQVQTVGLAHAATAHMATTASLAHAGAIHSAAPAPAVHTPPAHTPAAHLTAPSAHASLPAVHMADLHPATHQAAPRLHLPVKVIKMPAMKGIRFGIRIPIGLPSFGYHIVKQVSPVFCVPPNTDFLAYWDRVEGQLYKIRHCMDINGTVRQLALFAPPIDPRLLVEATAAGLSLEDVLSSISGDLPPYRFSYLIDKAKQYAAQVQSFGATLLATIEKRDGEQLNMLKLTQQKNLLAMTTKLRQFDIDIANNAIDTLNAQRATVQYRHDYYQGLVSGGLSTWENTQAGSRYAASAIYGVAAILAALGGVFHLIPDVGSPFSMKYGGKEAGDSIKAYGTAMQSGAAIAEAISASAGLVAGFERRSDGWQHQADLATKELAQIDKQIAGANIRLQMAQRAMEVHQKTIDQNQAVYDFCRDRFSNLGLYTWLATTMQRLYHSAFNAAYGMAKVAEQAYRFERNDNTTPLLAPSYWDSQHAGLLSGESLVADLNAMERRFIETNYRQLEVDQSFALSQIDPAALVSLRETGSCTFSVGEIFLDLFYPGQYCRRIRAVRLTIPCITPPFTNVSATLTMTGSKLRPTPVLGDSNLVDVPLQRTVSIAASTAQNDAGVFEFSFRDERYMPFEGAGAVSSWTLQLPAAFRQFDYQTITEGLLHISYTALQDGVLRQNVESQNAAIEGALLNVLKKQPLGRLFSLRQEFSTALNRLLHSPANTSVKVTITDKHLPIFIRSRNLRVTRAELLLRTAAGQTLKKFSLSIDGTAEAVFTADPTMGNLPSCDLTTVFAGGFLGDHTLMITSAGDLAPKSPAPGDLSALDDTKLLDVMVYVEFEVS